MNSIFSSLQTKIILLIVIVVSVILIVFTYINLQLLEKHSLEKMISSNTLLAKGMDASIESKKRLQDPELLKREINKIVSREVSEIVNSALGVDEIHIFLFTHSRRTSLTYPKLKQQIAEDVRFIIDSNNTQPPHVSEEIRRILDKDKSTFRIVGNQPGIRYLDVYVPMHQVKQIIGGIMVRTSLDELDKLVASRRRQMTVSTVITVVVLVITLGLLMQLLVFRPVNRLVNGMQKVESGDLSSRIFSNGNDELGRLTAQFNQMMSRLAETSQKNEQLLAQIESFNKELQTRVEQTTAELTLRNQELSEANELLMTMQRRLWETERLATLGQVAATIAHEIGTPLGAISGHIQLLKSNESEHPEIQRRLDLIDKQVTRVVNTVQQMLDSVRARTPEKQKVNIKEVMENVVSLLSPQLTTGKVKVVMQIPNNLPSIMLNMDAFHQIFLNLFTNAMDAMPDGGELTITANTLITTDSLFPQSIEIRVQDTGQGISLEDQDKIFEPFFTTKSPGKGTGLGLAVCKDIVERYNGTITVQSETGKGSVFCIRFPIGS